MDPKETKTFEHSQSPNPDETSDNTQGTDHILGATPHQQSSNNTHLDESKPGLWAGLRKPMKWALTIGVVIFILALIGSGLFNFAKGLMQGEDTPKPISTNPTTETDRPKTDPTPTTSSTAKNECLDLPARMAQANITADRVDKVFYQKYPDRSNKALADTQLDRSLRQEWCAVANQLIR